MAERKEVYGGDGGFAVIAGIVVVVLIGFGLLFMAGVLNENKRGVNVNVELPKADAPVRTE